MPGLRKWVRLPDFDLFNSRGPARTFPTRRISVVIPAHNEAVYLPRTLAALKAQDYFWFETVVVANGCSDATPEVARGLCDRLIVLSQKNLGVARNLGARMARGEILLFLDADTILSPGALRCIAENFQPEQAAGTIRGKPDCGKFRYKAFYAFKNLIHRLRLHTGSSGVILCWKDQFLRAGGFDERLEVRENSQLMSRLCRWGRYTYIGDATAITSMRRFEQRGLARVSWLWTKVWLQSLFGDLANRRYEIVR